MNGYRIKVTVRLELTDHDGFDMTALHDPRDLIDSGLSTENLAAHLVEHIEATARWERRPAEERASIFGVPVPKQP